MLNLFQHLTIRKINVIPVKEGISLNEFRVIIKKFPRGNDKIGND